MQGSSGEEEAACQDKVAFPGEEGEGNGVVVAVVKRLPQRTFKRARSSPGLTKIPIQQRLRSRRLWETGRTHPAPELPSHVHWQLVAETPMEKEAQLLLKESPQLPST